MSHISNISRSDLLAEGSELVQREAILLDDAQWDEWLDLYTEDCVFWVPAWRRDGTLVDNPRREVSHIYTSNKGGLEDRVYRVRSNHAVASIPLQRTTHMLSVSHFTAPPDPERMSFRTSWTSHIYFPRTRNIEAFFGHYEHDLVGDEEGWKIAKKKIVIKADYIATVMDFYFI